MKWITIQLMKYMLKQAIKKQTKQEHTIVKNAYNDLIKNYKDTIMFLKADS